MGFLREALEYTEQGPSDRISSLTTDVESFSTVLISSFNCWYQTATETPSSEAKADSSDTAGVWFGSGRHNGCFSTSW